MPVKSPLRIEPRPLRRDAERNRQRILVAAREVFADRGLDATLDDVAEHAGVGVGTVYRRFANKDQLVDALFEEGIAALLTVADQAMEISDPWEGVVFLLEKLQSKQAEDRGLAEILVRGDRGTERVARSRDKLVPATERVLARARDAGKLRAGITAADVRILGLALTAVTEYSRQVSPDLWRRYLTLILDGMRSRGGRMKSLPVAALNEKQMRTIFKRDDKASRR